ncbi:MAG: HPr(Ser) kinase/phosphatase [Deltaproteobacteria bacterium]|nr:HPr(Ser) kinase/phosphatase [Deltaproteobacteria bacterium]
MSSVPISQLLKEASDLRLEPLAGGERGTARRIASTRIQKPGLALVGHDVGLHSERLAVFGNTEMSFVRSLDHEGLERAAETLFGRGVAALVITKSFDPPPVFVKAANDAGICILGTPLLSGAFITRVTAFLEDALAPSTSLHGVLIDVLGVGVLILGKSGIGKSEAALDLVRRGHRLVADDIVDIKRLRRLLFGQGSELIRHHMEIRGIGIINIKDLFGVGAVRERKKIEMVIELVDWDPHVQYDRLGVEDHTFEILDITVPELTIPVRPGRNITTLIEVAARNHLLKLQGHHSALEFQEQLNRAIAEAGFAQAITADEVE